MLARNSTSHRKPVEPPEACRGQILDPFHFIQGSQAMPQEKRLAGGGGHHFCDHFPHEKRVDRLRIRISSARRFYRLCTLLGPKLSIALSRAGRQRFGSPNLAMRNVGLWRPLTKSKTARPSGTDATMPRSHVIAPKATVAAVGNGDC